jgi:hypothetical protein
VARTELFTPIDFASLCSAKSGGQGLLNITIDFASLCSAKSMVAKDGIEPPTHGFSVRCSTN